MNFSVYDPRLGIDVASRVQFPIKLAFALTIHKSQGMTIENVVIDCRAISAPGQLGVVFF